MLNRTLRHADLLALIRELGDSRRLIGPVAKGDRFFYQEVQDPALLNLAFNYSTYSPRNFLFPATETLFSFDRSKGAFSARTIINDRPLAFVGVHPCDIHAIQLLDKVFEKDHADEHYLARRRRTFIVGVDCARPCTEGAFCGDMQTNSAKNGFDVMLFPLDTAGANVALWGVTFGSDDGERWILSSPAAQLPTPLSQQAFEKYQQAKTAAFPRQLTSRFDELASLMDQSYDSLLWDATARRCYSCGSCNLVCPTCYCFNIYDELDLNGCTGERRREWDGCMLHEFASVAGGHNFRSKTSHRLRHRIYRKAGWIRQQTGMSGCVGCGRCCRACTAKISILELINQLAQEKADARSNAST